MNPIAAQELRRLIGLLKAGQANLEEQQLVAGFLQPASVILSQLPEHLVQILMFTDPERIEVLNLVLLTPEGVKSMDETAEQIPS